ncbi:Dabb family protein [Sphingomonadaceae bacterium G21617-S1]|nr:Dabb family protein [Sphingomonadaceae bacterium G21617-S1]
MSASPGWRRLGRFESSLGIASMIVHCSLWKFKDQVSSTQIDDIVRGYRDLGAKIPGVRAIQVGRDCRGLAGNHDIAALIFFDDIEGYQAYVDNQDHLDYAFGVLIPNIEGLDKRAAVQFEIPEEMAELISAMAMPKEPDRGYEGQGAG